MHKLFIHSQNVSPLSHIYIEWIMEQAERTHIYGDVSYYDFLFIHCGM